MIDVEIYGMIFRVKIEVWLRVLLENMLNILMMVFCCCLSSLVSIVVLILGIGIKELIWNIISVLIINSSLCFSLFKLFLVF